LESGKVYTLAKTGATAGGNSDALAYSEANLWLQAYCHGNAEAYARACAFTKADGKVHVDVTNYAGLKTVSLKIQVTSASTSYAFANSSALADAYAAVEAQSYTDTVAFCKSVGNRSPLCAAGTAKTDLSQVATSSANAFSDAVSEAGAGGFGKSKASVYVEGSSINTVSGHLVAIAKSWAFASVEASANAFASAATKIINESFTRVCVAQHKKICIVPQYAGKGVCGSSPQVACASAYAFGKAKGSALADSIAQAFLKVCSESATTAILKADVDCKSTPQLKWKSSRGGAEVSCPK
jgi:virulence-associated protein VapD